MASNDVHARVRPSAPPHVDDQARLSVDAGASRGVACAAVVACALSALGACVLPACGGHRLEERPVIVLDRVPIGYGVGHVTQTTFAIDPWQWRRIESTFLPVPADPHAERLAIGAALQQIHLIAGSQTPTWGDLPGDAGSVEPGGAVDCIDASKNNTTYLLLLQQRGLLRWHRVLSPATRVNWFHTHSTAVIEEVQPASTPLPPRARPGRRWAVDTWYGNCGDPPLISPLDDWFRLVPVPLDQPVIPP